MPAYYTLADVGRIIWVLFCVIAMLFAVYYFTRFYAKRSVGGRRSTYMQTLDVLPLTKDVYLALVRIGDTAVILSVSPRESRLLHSMPYSELQTLHERAQQEQPASGYTDSPVMQSLRNNPIYRAYMRLTHKDTASTHDFSHVLSDAAKRQEDRHHQDRP